MKLIINKDRSVIPVGTWGTKNENDFEIVDFEFPEELEGYNKRIVYLLGGGNNPWGVIDRNNKAYITSEITSKENVKGYVWCTKENRDRPADTDFRSREFDIPFYKNENATGVVPTPQQVDGFNEMLTEMNAKIDEADALEQTIETAESERQEAEATRVSNENTRQSNESTRESNEQTRQSQEAERERRTDEAIGEIEDLTEAYNQNAQQKTEAFNNNATQKTNDFNSNYTQKVNDFNTNASSKETAFNSNASSKTSDFNSNAETKTNTFNTNATNKTNAFNSNATEKTTTFNDNASTKTSEFNSNAESKTSAFNDNATQKTTTFDNNASEKTDEFNTNAQEKIDEYDEHIVEYQAQIDELQEEVDELSENMPWNTTEQATEIQVTDAAKYSKNKLELFGNTSQDSTNGSQAIDYSEVINREVNFNDVTLLISTTNFNIKADTTYYIRWIFTDNTYVDASSTLDNIRFYNGTSIQKQFGGTNIVFTSQDLDGITSVQVRATSTFASTYAGKTIKALVFSSDVNKITSDTYEPYTGGQPSPSPDFPQPIHVVTDNNTIGVAGKNILNWNLFEGNNYVNVINKTQKILSLTGKTKYYSGECILLNLKPNTQYTIKAIVTIIGTNSRGFIGIFNENYNGAGELSYSNRIAVSNTTTAPGEVLCTFTTDETGIIYIVFLCNDNTNNGSITYENIQLEEGAIASSFEPYTHRDYSLNLGSIELCKIGNYQDYLYKENGNWYIQKNTGKTILGKPTTGNLNTDYTYNYFSYRGEPSGIYPGTDIICSHFIGAYNVTDMRTQARYNNSVYWGSNGTYVRVDKFNTVEEYINALSANDITIIGRARTPTTTQITDETLIAQLDAIYEHLQLVKGTNNITVTPSDLAPYMELTYMQDLKSKLDNLDSRLALLE